MKKIVTYLFLSSTMLSVPAFAQLAPPTTNIEISAGKKDETPEQYQARRIRELTEARDQGLQDIKDGIDGFEMEGDAAMSIPTKPKSINDGFKPVWDLTNADINQRVQKEVGDSFSSHDYAAEIHADDEQYYQQSLPPPAAK